MQQHILIDISEQLHNRDIAVGIDITLATQALYQGTCKEAGTYKKVVLEPLMVVAGAHAHNDMAGDEDDSWKSTFEKAGYTVDCQVEGLGQLEAIQQLFVEHAKAAVASAEAE